MNSFAAKIARAGLQIGALKLNPERPFQWASGYRMPVYNDNRMFLSYPDYRRMILDGFHQVLLDQESARGQRILYAMIAGTSTAGIPWGTLLAEETGKPFIYVRDKPKDYGLRNQIEGIDAKRDLENKLVLLIEDLISTGGSSARAVQALRDANGDCRYCLSIFDYGLDKTVEEFRALNPPCQTISLLTYRVLLEVATETGHLTQPQVKVLEEWDADPFNWGEKHGFPRIKKRGE